jgi:4a-hydroxytetrahydrobiopterin dehydratase
MASRLLSDIEILDVLAEHPEWVSDGDGLRRTFVFDDFNAAFGFMTRAALVSERMFHHPEWSNAYNRVEIRITDHDAGGISTNDRDWLDRVDRLLA